jgi:hypothetical protein
MRLIAMLLFAAALAKVGLVQHLRQAGARDVIVAAYAADAIRTCEQGDPSLKLAATAASDIEMFVGDRVHRVSLWQVDSPEWATRYRQVFLVLKTPDGQPACRFDVIHRTAKTVGNPS